MIRYVMDTDLFSLYLSGHLVVQAHLLAVPADEVAITAVTVSELTQGWLAQINRHNVRGGPALWRAYDRLAQLPLQLLPMIILSYGDAEEQRFLAWRRNGIRIGTNDLRITAIAAEAGATVVTRNSVDFGQVPGLRTADWSV